jgi:DNA-binding LacI/PurR family transcriptional regulator
MVSSKDVAKIAGVSQATVSRVLNNPESVKGPTKQKVIDAMKQLKYQPNLIARSLVTNSTKTIGLISGSITNPFFVETTKSIIDFAMNKGYKTMVFFEEEIDLNEAFLSLLGNRVDGILLSTIKLEDPLFEEIESSGIPYMFFNRRPKNGGNYVVFDNKMAAQLVTTHLLDLGHNRIAYLTGEDDRSTFYERKLGFKQEMNKKSVKVDVELIHTISDLDDVEKATWKLMNLNQPPTAIICATDAMALRCMDLLLSMGMKIPEDVSIAGIDDISLSSHYAIQLTSVGHHRFKMGEVAAENLFEIINGDEVKKRHIILKPDLFVRKTTSPPRKISK